MISIARSTAALPQSFTAATLCEAFQITASERPDAVALRTPGGGVEISWAEYAERVRRIAGGLAALGIVRGEELTSTMKLKRKPIHAKYTAEVDALYAG